MKLGHIRKRGKSSWELKVELPADPVTGRRRSHFETIRGSKAAAKARLVELAEQLRTGTHVEKSAHTVQTYMTAWLDAPTDLSAKTVERYQQLADRQLYPHLGAVPLQKLKPAHVQDLHGHLLKTLSAQTVKHCHALLRRAMQRALEGGLIHSNPVSVVKAPKVEPKEIEILDTAGIATLLSGIGGHWLYPIAVTALGSGLRRGELLALRLSDVNLKAACLQVDRSLEETKAGLRFKAPKTKHGRRSVSLPHGVVTVLQEHRTQQLRTRMMLGLGRPDGDALVFCQHDGAPWRPDKVSRDWANLVRTRKLPKVSLHGLRHTHVSTLIAAGLDVRSISQRVGHGSAALTLDVYGHMFKRRDDEAAAAIDAVLPI